VIDYVLKTTAAGPVTLEILDAAGTLVRHYASTDPAEPQDPATAAVPIHWYRTPRALPGTAGMHRFQWDLHYQALPGGGGRGGGGGLPIAAVPFNTASPSNAPWVAPGVYTVKLTVDGKSYTQPMTVKMDPRVKTPALGLQQQATLSKALYDGALDTQAALVALRNLRTSVKVAQDAAGQNPVAKALAAFDAKAVALEGVGGGGGGGRGGAAAPGAAPAETLSSFSGSVTSIIGLLQAADVTPTSQVVAGAAERQKALASLMAKWAALKTTELTALNALLKQAGQPPIVIR
jgi:hypothetical protein